jgi:putative ABC transport system ATP-binding protein
VKSGRSGARKYELARAIAGAEEFGKLFGAEPGARTCVWEMSSARKSQGKDSPAMLKLRNLEKAFDTKAGKTYVLRRINLDVADGEFVTVMGPSGAGKSTLLGIVGMLDGAWSGEYWMLDQPVHRLSLKQRAELNKKYIGFVFQQYHLLDNLTVYENLEIPLSYRNISRKEREAVVADTLDRFNIVGKKDLFPSQLSGGQQQLVAVARAVIANPKLILADEPTGNLHTAQGREIMELFKKLNEQGTTIIQVTHSEVNASYGHRTINLLDGWVVNEEEAAPAAT